MIMGQCVISAAPHHPEVWARGDNSFLVWHPVEEEFRIRCNKNQRAATRFQGVKKVSLKKGCSGSNSVVSVYGSSRTVFSESHTLAPPLTVNASELLPEEVSASGAPRHFRPPILHDARDLKLETWNPTTDSRVHIAAGTSMAVILFLSVLFLRWWCRNRRRTLRPGRPLSGRHGRNSSDETGRSSSDYALSPGGFISHHPRGTEETPAAQRVFLTGMTTLSGRRESESRPLPLIPRRPSSSKKQSRERRTSEPGGGSYPSWQEQERAYESLSAVTARERMEPPPVMRSQGITRIDNLDPRGIGRILSNRKSSD